MVKKVSIKNLVAEISHSYKIDPCLPAGRLRRQPRRPPPQDDKKTTIQTDKNSFKF